MKRNQAEDIVNLIDRMITKKIKFSQDNKHLDSHPDDDIDLKVELTRVLVETLP